MVTAASLSISAVRQSVSKSMALKIETVYYFRGSGKTRPPGPCLGYDSIIFRASFSVGYGLSIFGFLFKKVR